MFFILEIVNLLVIPIIILCNTYIELYFTSHNFFLLYTLHCRYTFKSIRINFFYVKLKVLEMNY